MPTVRPTDCYTTQDPTSQPTANVVLFTTSPTKLPTPNPTAPLTPRPTKFPTPNPTADEDEASGTWFPTMDFYDVSERITCIAVVDDSQVSTDTLNSSWAEFRKNYPLRSFCLLQPLPDQKSELNIPAAFDNDPNTTYAQVNRDYGVAAAASDWYELCGLSRLQREGITKVAISIDTPQLYAATYVRAAYELFLIRITAERVSLVQVPEGVDENWISPFLETFF